MDVNRFMDGCIIFDDTFNSCHENDCYICVMWMCHDHDVMCRILVQTFSPHIFHTLT